ncbi:hypothetical protein EDD86DRAFT_190817 [Gorgonomyces haynaldii]|nr:hypothetical protein EDD86DRAFT_190817 [Gorgonomyces haynaldii]
MARNLALIPWKPLLQRLLGVWNVSFVVLCFLGPFYTPTAYSIYYVFLHIIYAINNVRTFWGAYQGYIQSVRHSKTDWVQRYCDKACVSSIYDPRHDLPYSSVQHIIIIPNYKESFDTLCETLDVLASHEMALTQYMVCLAMEQAEQGATEKAKNIIQIYQDSFYHITFTLHPANQPGETRGKSSNVNYAAKQMAYIHGVKPSTVLTVMDADTCFAQDYFTSVTFHFSTSKPEDRDISFFVAPTLFDRNAHNVPAVVRVADMTWSAACMSVNYEESKIKMACSAYSLSFKLAEAVGFWDTDSHSVAEDYHMSLKCYFATQGRLKSTTIYSPISSCNVQADTYLKGITDRYGQAKRHMWAGLEMGYTVRRLIFGLLAPGYDAPNGVVERFPLLAKNDISILLRQTPLMLHRNVEAHLAMGQVFLLMATSAIVLQFPGVSPFVLYLDQIGAWVRLLFAPFFVMMLYQHHLYHQWNADQRWRLSMHEQMQAGSGQGVQPLGRQPRLQSVRKWYNVFDYVFLPIAGFLYLTLPQFHAHVLQLFMEKLDYTVAGKPTIEKEPVQDLFPTSRSTQLLSSYVAEEGESAISISSRGDSGFYDFEPKQGAPYSPSMWNVQSGQDDNMSQLEMA